MENCEPVNNAKILSVDEINLEPTVLGPASELTEEGGTTTCDRDVIIWADF